MPGYLIPLDTRLRVPARARLHGAGLRWSLPKAIAYGLGLALLFAILVFDIAGETWPVAGCEACVSDPSGDAGRPLLPF